MGNRSRRRQFSKQTEEKAYYSAKVFYASPDDVATRTPELYPLREKAVAVFGLGTLGAESVLEFARSGVRKICIVDHDIVDPATTVRWPMGFVVAGHFVCAVWREHY